MSKNIIKVDDVKDLESAIKKSSKGDSIVLKDNTYKNAGVIGIDVSGISVTPETPGGVIFTGNSGFKIMGSGNLISGFQFKEGDLGKDKASVIEVSGNYNTISNCNFYHFISHNYVHFEEGSHHNTLSYCNLEAKPATMNAGPAIQITTSESVVNHTLISHCTFMNFDGDGGDFGNEPIRIGLGKEQNNTSGAVIEYCYFENLGKGDNETISVKSTYNVIRYNTFNNNPLGQLTFRTGNKNTAYGNYFINSGGIRIKEGFDHMVYNNYFEGAGDSKFPTIKLMNFVMNKKTNLGSPLKNILIYHNTFYNPGDIDLGGEGQYPPEDVIFENNIFFKENDSLFMNLNQNVKFKNNLFFGKAKMMVKVQSNEIKIQNPVLKKNKFGYYALVAESPAVGAAISVEPLLGDNPEVDDDYSLQLDIEGQKRKSKKDIGCDEFTNGNQSNIMLKKSDVGPAYLK